MERQRIPARARSRRNLRLLALAQFGRLALRALLVILLDDRDLRRDLCVDISIPRRDPFAVDGDILLRDSGKLDLCGRRRSFSIWIPTTREKQRTNREQDKICRCDFSSWVGHQIEFSWPSQRWCAPIVRRVLDCGAHFVSESRRQSP